MQTQHAWLIEDRHGPQVLDSLTWTTDRSHGGFAVDPSAKQVRIGIPLPQMPGADPKVGFEVSVNRSPPCDPLASARLEHSRDSTDRCNCNVRLESNGS